jgi:hypothetical protein
MRNGVIRLKPMRIWTVHPRYLDRQGLTALWRETLLAQAVLLGETKGYRNHPQLERFRAQREPAAAIARYLSVVYEEACRRGYCFDAAKIGKGRAAAPMVETDGQLLYEWQHLKNKLKERSPEVYKEIAHIKQPSAHPMFQIVPGGVRSWEKQKK